VDRMVRRAPGVPADAWRRIVHEVITVSLDLAEPPSMPGRAARDLRGMSQHPLVEE
jgi:hypothetical protein